MTYDELLVKYQNVVTVCEISLEYNLEGCYSNGIIFIEKSLSEINKKCILAEELGHHFTSTGNILDTRCVTNLKQERQAHIWAVKELISYSKFIAAIKLYTSDYDRAEYLEVSLWFLEDIYYVYEYVKQEYCFDTAYELCF